MRLARLEGGRVRELRADFRETYHVAYDDVPVEEAIDLALALPAGSRFRAANSPASGWTRKDYMLANAVDLLTVLCWRAAGSPQANRPEPMERPGDAAAREAARERARATRERITETKWKDVGSG